MLLTNFTFSSKVRQPAYMQLVNFIKNQVHQKELAAGNRLPSIRKLAEALDISRTTVETAYSILVADGYLTNQPQRGYYVTELAAEEPGPSESSPPCLEHPGSPPPSSTASGGFAGPSCRYNFANNYVDAATFPADLWRRHLNKVLTNKEALRTYGDFQGEPDLRRALADYSRQSRGVICTPGQIVVGAGVQSLLVILAALLKDELKAVSVTPSLALEKPGFPQAEEVFYREGWQINHFAIEQLELGSRPESLRPRVLYVSPSNPYKGRSLTSAQRLELLHWCRKTGGYVLEDDYNGEFRYFARPLTSLQGLSDGENIIYLGSFSRLLLPSLRISYLVLPLPLLPAYKRIGYLYNQTSSTIEQLALASFIDAGLLRRHVKRLRKIYNGKNTLLRRYLQQYLGTRAEVLAYESGLHLHLKVHSPLSSRELAEKALAAGVKIIPVQGTREVLLSFAGIDEDDIQPAVKLLAETWFKQRPSET